MADKTIQQLTTEITSVESEDLYLIQTTEGETGKVKAENILPEEIVKLVNTASAVNEVTVTNAATGNAVKVEATGGDTNIYTDIRGKGDAGVLLQLPLQSNTTNTYPGSVLIQHGWGWIQGDGSNRTLQENVTFPVGYSSPPMFLVSPIGALTGSDPTGPGDTAGVITLNFGAGTYDVSTTTASVQIARRSVDGADPGVLGSTTRYMYSWIAIGTK